MAYLLPATTSVRNRKLGAFGPGQYYRPGLLHGFYRRTRGRIRRGLSFVDPLPTDPITMVLSWPPTTPTAPSAGQGTGSPTDRAYRDLLTSARPSSDPLDYISPQAAIAAGLEPSRVYAAWSNSLRSQIASGQIKSQQDAIAQGWSPGVVTELWTQAAGSAAISSSNWLDQTPLGVPNKWLIAGGAGIFLLVGMRGRR